MDLIIWFDGLSDIALDIVHIFLQQDPPLAVTIHPRQRSSPLRFLATKPELFRSHSCDLGFWGRLMYSCMYPLIYIQSITLTFSHFKPC